MKHYAGLDVSVKETSVCIMDEAGTVCREVKVPSHPQDLVRVLKEPAWQVERIGLEAGHCLNGCSAGLRRRACLSSASRPGTRRPSSRLR